MIQDSRRFSGRSGRAGIVAGGIAGLLALSLAVAVEPAAASGKRARADSSKADAAIAAVKDEPMTLIVSLGSQTVNVYRGTTPITSSHVSTGRPGHKTITGVFSILQKQRYHRSNMYGDAPMPWMQRITWSGTALHAGYVPNYPASHGCIRLPQSFAIKLWGLTDVGESVVVTRDNPKPQFIENPNLFQPMQRPQLSVVAENDHKTGPAGTGGATAMNQPSGPLILASAKIGGDVRPALSRDPSNDDAPATAADIHATKPDDVPRVHAITDDANNGTHAIALGETPLSTPHAITIGDSAPAPTSGPAHADHPPSAIAKEAAKGADAAAIAAAEPVNDAPLRILITKTTQRDKVMGVQYQLKDLGYLQPEMFDGTFGAKTIAAIKAFQKDHNMPETGAVTDDVVAAIYKANGKTGPADGHIFVRQNFDRVFDAPISYKDPDKPLGTQLYTVMNFTSRDAKANWIEVSLNGGDPNAALNRIEVPEKIRRWISERLTPGSSLIIADTSINTAALKKGADFVVLANDPGALGGTSGYGAPAGPTDHYSRRVIVEQPQPDPQQSFQPRRSGPHSPFWLRF